MINVIVICAFADKNSPKELFVFDSFAGDQTKLPFTPRVGMKIDLEGFRTPGIDNDVDFDDVILPVCEIKDIIFINEEEAEIWCYLVDESSWKL